MRKMGNFTSIASTPKQIAMKDALEKIQKDGYILEEIQTEFGVSLKYPEEEVARSLHISRLYSNDTRSILVYDVLQLEVINTGTAKTLPFYLGGVHMAIESEKSDIPELFKAIPLATQETREPIRLKLPAPPRTAIEKAESVLEGLSFDNLSDVPTPEKIIEALGNSVQRGGTVCFTKQEDFDNYWNLIIKDRAKNIHWFRQVVEEPHTELTFRKLLTVLLWDQ